jgi:porin
MPLHLTKPVARIVVAIGVSVGFWAFSSVANAEDTKPSDIGLIKSLVPDVLTKLGVQLNATYIGETLGNVSGGVKRGIIYEGRLDAGIDIDLEQFMGWSGAKFHANMFQIHGQGLSRDYIGNLLLTSNIEALPATRLYELWIEQSLLGDKIAIRVGQQAADVEFFDSKYDDIFINSTFGWPAIVGINLPSGGPSPPLAVPGIRLKAQVSDQITAYAAIFDGDAAGPGPGDPQIRNPNGLAFRVNDPPLFLGQVKYDFNLGKKGSELPGAIVVGGWYHTGPFNDQRFTAQGVSLADPQGSGTPRQLQTNHGLYLVYEQLLSRIAPNSDNGVAVFTRASVSPSDRNLISFYIDGGLLFSGIMPSRPNDKFGVALGYARISDAAQQLDHDVQYFTSTPIPIRDYEAVFELTYQAEVKPGWTLQPLFQYIIHPGGGSVDTNDAIRRTRIRDAAVLGLRTTVRF